MHNGFEKEDQIHRESNVFQALFFLDANLTLRLLYFSIAKLSARMPEGSVEAKASSLIFFDIFFYVFVICILLTSDCTEPSEHLIEIIPLIVVTSDTSWQRIHITHRNSCGEVWFLVKVCLWIQVGLDYLVWFRQRWINDCGAGTQSLLHQPLDLYPMASRRGFAQYAGFSLIECGE
jgi:hypothetical protein